AAFRPDWRYGVVAAVALSLGSVENTTDTAIDRGIAIGLGVAIGMISSFIIWPDSAASRARRHAQSALIDIRRRLDAILSHVFGDFKENKQKKAQRDFHDHVKDARSAVRSMTGDQQSAVEDYLDGIEHLNNSVLLIDRALSDAKNTDEVGEDVVEWLKGFQEQTRTVIDGLTGEDVDVKSAISKLEQGLQKGGQPKTGGQSAETRRQEISVIDFGVREVIADLKSLIEISKRVHDGSDGAQKLAYMAREMTYSR
ncbi:MAG: hypothetical protein AAFW68_06710, partial [Pseudomonadota bacterium]